jgi:hypothetical protein
MRWRRLDWDRDTATTKPCGMTLKRRFHIHFLPPKSRLINKSILTQTVNLQFISCQLFPAVRRRQFLLNRGYELCRQHSGPAIRAQLEAGGSGETDRRRVANHSVSSWERGIAKPSRENIYEFIRSFAVRWNTFLTKGHEREHTHSVQETGSPSLSALSS